MVRGFCCCCRRRPLPAGTCVVLSEGASRRAQFRWTRLARRLLRIRFRQRLWGHLGQYLQFIVGDHLRARVLYHLPAPSLSRSEALRLRSRFSQNLD